MKLTEEQRRYKLAELCGWAKRYSEARSEYRWYSPDGLSFLLPPDYCYDLNAMHEAETICLPCDSDELRDKYAELLQDAVYRESEKRAWFSATALQRFEALGQTLEQWEAGE